jgi:uncharacterized membrane protein YfcA
VIGLGYLLAILIGLSLGLLGGGGSILTVPVLVYGLGYGMKAAVPMSLVVVGLVSIVGVIQHQRAGNVRWDTALLFAPAAMAGALIGGRLAHYLTGRAQLQIFAVLMVAASISMFRRPIQGPAADPGRDRRPWALIAIAGLVVGALTGLVGVGGGFIYVPALVLLCAIPMRTAVGTSLVLIVVSCVSAFVSYRGWVAMNWGSLGLFTALAAAGVVVGSALCKHVDQGRLRRIFAVFLVVMGILVFLRPR